VDFGFFLADFGPCVGSRGVVSPVTSQGSCRQVMLLFLRAEVIKLLGVSWRVGYQNREYG
jgi:hypothetical protein